MTKTATERVRASAWQWWETWRRLDGCEAFGVRIYDHQGCTD